MQGREILGRGMRALRRSALWWAIGIVSFIVVNLAFWPSLESSAALDGFDEMGALLEAFGAQNIATPAGYIDGQLFALLIPLLLSAMVIMSVSGLTAGDETAGRLELLHALPVGRRTVWFGRWLASMLTLIGVSVAGGLVTLVCLPVFSLDEVAPGRVIGATIGSALLALLHGAVAYLVAGFGGNRAQSAGAAFVVLIVGYVLNFILPISDALAGARRWSPWNWALGEQPVTNGIGATGTTLVAVAGLTCVAAGTWAIERRDLRTA